MQEEFSVQGRLEIVQPVVDPGRIGIRGFDRLCFSIPVLRLNPDVRGALDVLPIDEIAQVDAHQTFAVRLVEKGVTAARNLHCYFFHFTLSLKLNIRVSLSKEQVWRPVLRPQLP